VKCGRGLCRDWLARFVLGIRLWEEPLEAGRGNPPARIRQAGESTMKRYAWKIGLIVGSTLLGLLFMWPPSQKLKLGIDLSGGTILVYEVVRENLPPGFNMDELISALKKRADPEGVKEIPIRKIGGNRIEIILPQASNEEVEEVKKMLVDVGSLEFRILANRKHDKDVIPAALGPRGMKPPPRYK